MHAHTTTNCLSEDDGKMAEASKTLTFPAWKYSHYFNLVGQDDKNNTVKCQLCPGEKHLTLLLKMTVGLPHLNGSRGQAVTQGELNQHVAGYVVEEMLPLSSVDIMSVIIRLIVLVHRPT